MSRMSYLRIGVVAAMALVLCVGSVNADIITVTNPSFETPTLSDGGWNAPTGGWASVSGVNWIVNPTADQFPGSTGTGTPVGADGTNVFLEEGTTFGYIYQTTGATFTANKVYTLTVAVGESDVEPCMDNSFDIDLRYGITGLGSYGTQVGTMLPALFHVDHPGTPTALLTAGEFQRLQRHLYRASRRSQLGKVRANPDRGGGECQLRLPNLFRQRSAHRGTGTGAERAGIGDQRPDRPALLRLAKKEVADSGRNVVWLTSPLSGQPTEGCSGVG